MAKYTEWRIPRNPQFLAVLDYWASNKGFSLKKDSEDTRLYVGKDWARVAVRIEKDSSFTLRAWLSISPAHRAMRLWLVGETTDIEPGGFFATQKAQAAKNINPLLKSLQLDTLSQPPSKFGNSKWTTPVLIFFMVVWAALNYSNLTLQHYTFAKPESLRFSVEQVKIMTVVIQGGMALAILAAHWFFNRKRNLRVLTLWFGIFVFLVSISSQYNTNVFAENFNRASYFCFDRQEGEKCEQALEKLERSPAGSKNPKMEKELEKFLNAYPNQGAIRRILNSVQKIAN